MDQVLGGRSIGNQAYWRLQKEDCKAIAPHAKKVRKYIAADKKPETNKEMNTTSTTSTLAKIVESQSQDKSTTICL
jgi:hypothetical protein